MHNKLTFTKTGYKSIAVILFIKIVTTANIIPTIVISFQVILESFLNINSLNIKIRITIKLTYFIDNEFKLAKMING
ncbi:hypothetical protein [Francisella sp. SYW-9]|uniref:hypothetical protein n=1 Tax=Francisella sp. SYW-9 TaxID=2610888 RepID=UPI001CD05D90|nr:hypothetical protein [Francisella sp. SYW-9]